MPRTINQGFSDFHYKITPSSYQSGKASSHKQSITSKLEEDFLARQLFYSGSANNGTSISIHSDVDIFAEIPADQLKTNSSTTLREIKESLQRRFPNTSVYVDSPAIVCNFGSASWDVAEIIPADYVGMSGGYKVYEIPDGNGNWMRSSPMNHTTYVTEHNERLGKKLKPLIRFIKAWKYYCNVPISSFYLELRVTKMMEAEKSIEYSIDINNILKKLNSAELAAMQDPKGISGYVYPCKSVAQAEDALSKLNTASIRAEKARQAERDGDIHEAFHWWNLLFGNGFPSYYL